MSLSSSISWLLVWLVLMVSFLRYKAWSVRPNNTKYKDVLSASLTQICKRRTTLCATELQQEGYGRYVRNTAGYREMAKNYLMLLQPGIALFAILGIIFIFILSSALWWDTSATAAEILAVFGPVRRSSPYK